MSSTPPLSNRIPAWLLLLLAAFGVPTAAGFAFADQITQNPWLAFGLFVLYELCVVVSGFATQVGQHLGKRWSESAANQIDATARTFLPNRRFRKEYRQHLIYQHRSFDVKGLSTQGPFTLELERVFVELRVEPQAFHHISKAPIQAIPEDLQEGSHDIWTFLQHRQKSFQNMAVIGAPGSGKTTLLKSVALTLAAQRKHRSHINVSNKLPILLFLRNHAQAIKENPDLLLVQAVCNSLQKQQGPSAPLNWFEQRLKKGHCLIMLDGLDEVADPTLRKQVVEWVERQMGAYPTNQFIVTSRPFGYHSNPLSSVVVLEVRPFSNAQVQRFVHNWYTANEIMSAQKDDLGVRMAAREGAEDLLRRLNTTPALAALAVNPLLLTMIANVHRFRSSLPGRRVELYTEICEVFLGKRQQARGLELDLTPAQKQSVLQVLAYHMMLNEQREIDLDAVLSVIAEPLALVKPHASDEEFLTMVEDSSGLLIQRESGEYSFAHLTFQEYLAAAHIHEQKLQHELINKVEMSWWHETIRLYAAMADATPIVAACIHGNKPSVAALTLALECLEEAKQLKPEIREQLEAVLAKGVEDADPERRQLVAETLLTMRLRRMTRLDEHYYVDTSLITNAEYQLFLDERRAKGFYHQPDHWAEPQFPAGTGREPVLGMRPSDAAAFCEWLSNRDGVTWRYHVPVHAAPTSDSTKITIDMPPKVGYWAAGKNDYIWSNNCTSGAADTHLPYLQRHFEYDLDDVYLFVIVQLLLYSDRARDLALDRDRALLRARDFTSASDFARALLRALDRDRALLLARDLDRDLALALDRDFTSASDFALDRARARALKSIGNQAVAQSRAVNLEHVCSTVNILNLASDWWFVDTLPFERAVEQAFSRIAQQRTDQSTDVVTTRWMLRIYALGNIVDLSIQSEQSQTWLDQFRSNNRDAQDEQQQLLDQYCELYVSLVILEERIPGNLSAVEGIRIVCEPKNRDT